MKRNHILNEIRIYATITLSLIIGSLGWGAFIIPSDIVGGGIVGIASIVYYIFNISVGPINLAINAILVLIAIKILGKSFGVKTIAGMLLLSGWISAIEYFYGYEPFVPGQPMLSALYGGVLIGIGLGLVFKSKATSGGSDIIAMIAAKYIHMSLGQLMIIVDSIIVLLSWIAFKDPMIPLFSWIIIFITGKVVDVVIGGIGY